MLPMPTANDSADMTKSNLPTHVPRSVFATSTLSPRASTSFVSKAESGFSCLFSMLSQSKYVSTRALLFLVRRSHEQNCLLRRVKPLSILCQLTVYTVPQRYFFRRRAAAGATHSLNLKALINYGSRSSFSGVVSYTSQSVRILRTTRYKKL